MTKLVIVFSVLCIVFSLLCLVLSLFCLHVLPLGVTKLDEQHGKHDWYAGEHSDLSSKIFN